MVNIRTALGPSEGGQWKNVCQDIGLEYNPTREFVLSNAVCGGSRKNMSYAEVKKAASSAGGIARQNISRKDNDGLTTIEVWIRDNPEEMKRVIIFSFSFMSRMLILFFILSRCTKFSQINLEQLDI